MPLVIELPVTLCITSIIHFKLRTMRTLSIYAVILFSLFSTSSFAQTLKKETIKVWGNCSMCKTTIEKAAKSAGAKTASWDEESKELQVSYAVNKTSNTRIQKAIANKGYDTQDLTADNSVYEKLHSCCQYERKSTTAATEKKFAHGENCKHEGEEKCSKACATADGTKKSCCSKEEKH